MTPNDILSGYPTLPTQRQIAFLASLVAALTVGARDTYEAGTEQVADPPRLRAFNELQHRLANHLASLIERRDARYPDDHIAAIIVEGTSELRCEWALRRAWDSVHQPTAVTSD